MVKIRLKRIGATKCPKYRMVVSDGRVRRDGRVIEEIGFYDPLKEPAEVRINEQAALKWLRCGAQPTDTARELLKKIGAFEKLAQPTA